MPSAAGSEAFSALESTLDIGDELPDPTLQRASPFALRLFSKLIVFVRQSRTLRFRRLQQAVERLKQRFQLRTHSGNAFFRIASASASGIGLWSMSQTISNCLNVPCN